MAKLVFDRDGHRFFEYGVRDVALYPGKVKAGEVLKTGVVWNGITNVTEAPTGADPNDLWADDMKYASIRGLEKFEGSIACYDTPEAFDECDGIVTVLHAIKVYQQARKPFCIAYKTRIGSDAGEDDNIFKQHVIYNLTAAPSSKARNTIKDSPEAASYSYNVKSTPVVANAADKALFDGAEIEPYSHIEFTVDLNTTQKIDDAMTAAEYAKLEAKLYGTEDTAPQIGCYSFLVDGNDPT